jgi:hypothetical protein
VDANHTCNIRVAGIHPTDVGTARCLVAKESFRATRAARPMP